MQDNEKKPALRFKGFTDPWEQRKFGEVVDKYEDPVETPHDGYYRLGIRSHAKGTFHSYVEKGHELETAQMYRVAAGNFIVNITFGWEHAVAITNESDAGKLVSHRFPQYSFHDDMLPEFFKYVIADEDFRHWLWLASPGGAGRNRVLKLDEMLNYEMVLPSKEEQQRIAAIFRNLDTLITLHQRKYEKLVNIKKSMLDKMFPPNGASVPEIRFKGFTDPWEQRKVGTLIEDYTEKTVTQNQYPVLTSSQQQGIVLQEDYFADRQVTTDNNVGYYVLPKGYFTYRSRSDTDVFVFNRNNIVDKGIISYYYPVFAPKSCDSNFLLRRLNHGIKKQLSMAAEGTGQKVLAHAKFKNMVVDVPSQSEQEKIGTILEELDTLITLHQREHIKPILEVKRVKRNE